MNLKVVKLRNFVAIYCPKLLKIIEVFRLAYFYWANLREKGWSVPLPYMLKRSMIASFARLCDAKELVETGTYLGDTPWSLKENFEKIWSIEVCEPLAKLAKRRFEHEPKITIINGDSRHEIVQIAKSCSKTVLYWLDGHYCGGKSGIGDLYCPIFDELGFIFQHTTQKFTIMIDDIRLFGKERGYPSIESLFMFISKLPGPPICWVENDILYIIPVSQPLYSKCKQAPSNTTISMYSQ